MFRPRRYLARVFCTGDDAVRLRWPDLCITKSIHRLFLADFEDYIYFRWNHLRARLIWKHFCAFEHIFLPWRQRIPYKIGSTMTLHERWIMSVLISVFFSEFCGFVSLLENLVDMRRFCSILRHSFLRIFYIVSFFGRSLFKIHSRE